MYWCGTCLGTWRFNQASCGRYLEMMWAIWMTQLLRKAASSSRLGRNIDGDTSLMSSTRGVLSGSSNADILFWTAIILHMCKSWFCFITLMKWASSRMSKLSKIILYVGVRIRLYCSRVLFGIIPHWIASSTKASSDTFFCHSKTSLSKSFPNAICLLWAVPYEEQMNRAFSRLNASFLAPALFKIIAVITPCRFMKFDRQLRRVEAAAMIPGLMVVWSLFRVLFRFCVEVAAVLRIERSTGALSWSSASWSLYDHLSRSSGELFLKRDGFDDEQISSHSRRTASWDSEEEKTNKINLNTSDIWTNSFIAFLADLVNTPVPLDDHVGEININIIIMIINYYYYNRITHKNIKYKIQKKLCIKSNWHS